MTNETKQGLLSFKINIQTECHISCIWCALSIYFHESLQREAAEVRADPCFLALNARAVGGILRADQVRFFYRALCLPPPSRANMPFHRSRGVWVLWRADGNLFSPSEMTPPIVANTSGEAVSEPTQGGILPPKVSPILQRGQKQAGIALTRANPSSCGT